jgi:hypothetical protein
LSIFPQVPGMSRAVVLDQLERFAQDVAPSLRSRAMTIETAPPSRAEFPEAALSAIEGHQAKSRQSAAPAAH